MLPSSATASTWFSLSFTVNEIFPIHKTAASMENTLSWSSLLTWTISRASWKKKILINYMHASSFIYMIEKKIVTKMMGTGSGHQEGKKYHNNAKLLSIINPINWITTALLQILILMCSLQIQFLCVSKD